MSMGKTIISVQRILESLTVTVFALLLLATAISVVAADAPDTTNITDEQGALTIKKEQWLEKEGGIYVCPGEYNSRNDLCRVKAPGVYGFIGSKQIVVEMPLDIYIEQQVGRAITTINATSNSNDGFHISFEIDPTAEPEEYNLNLTAEQQKYNKTVMTASRTMLSLIGGLTVIVLGFTTYEISRSTGSRTLSTDPRNRDRHIPNVPVVSTTHQKRATPTPEKQSALEKVSTFSSSRKKLQREECNSCSGRLDEKLTCLYCGSNHYFA